jgi:hypothetical protein
MFLQHYMKCATPPASTGSTTSMTSPILIPAEVEIIFYRLGTVHFAQKMAAKMREF